MVASTAVRFAAVAAKFPAVREDYTIALCELASVEPTAFRLQIALEESFFYDIAQIFEARGLQNVQVTVCENIEALFRLRCGESLEIPMEDVANPPHSVCFGRHRARVYLRQIQWLCVVS